MSDVQTARSGALAVLEIDLDAIAENYLTLKKKLRAGADCAAVVKADAYGLGALPVSRTLFAQGCRHFFVATAAEAFAIRDVLPAAALIYVLNGPWGAAPAAFSAAGLIPVLNTPEDLACWQAAAKTAERRLPAVLQLDTGMNRLGLSAADVERLEAETFKALDIRYVMSHLACADDPVHDKNVTQRDLFETLTGRLPVPCRRSLANSAGIFLGPEYHFDLVRPGCGLYGISPLAQGENQLRNPVTLRARILQIRRIDRPETVGYGATHTVVPPAKCATISAGYADGYLRSLSGRGAVFIGGEKCPVIGRVSMDTIVVDITKLTLACQVGDWAEIIGPRQTADDVARQAGTIGYEILTGLGARYERNYITT